MRTKLTLMMTSLLGLSILIISNQEATGATSTSKQISTLQKQVSKLQSQLEELQSQVDISQGELQRLQYRVITVENGIATVSKFATYKESVITYLHVNERSTVSFCPSGTFEDFLGLGSVQVPYRSYSDTAGTYKNSLDVLKCTITVLTKKP